MRENEYLDKWDIGLESKRKLLGGGPARASAVVAVDFLGGELLHYLPEPVVPIELTAAACQTAITGRKMQCRGKIGLDEAGGPV